MSDIEKDIEKLEKELSEAEYKLRLAIDSYYSPLYDCRDSDIEYFLSRADSKVQPFRDKVKSIKMELDQLKNGGL